MSQYDRDAALKARELSMIASKKKRYVLRKKDKKTERDPRGGGRGEGGKVERGGTPGGLRVPTKGPKRPNRAEERTVLEDVPEEVLNSDDGHSDAETDDDGNSQSNAGGATDARSARSDPNGLGNGDAPASAKPRRTAGQPKARRPPAASSTSPTPTPSKRRRDVNKKPVRSSPRPPTPSKSPLVAATETAGQASSPLGGDSTMEAVVVSAGPLPSRNLARTPPNGAVQTPHPPRQPQAREEEGDGEEREGISTPVSQHSDDGGEGGASHPQPPPTNPTSPADNTDEKDRLHASPTAPAPLNPAGASASAGDGTALTTASPLAPKGDVKGFDKARPKGQRVERERRRGGEGHGREGHPEGANHHRGKRGGGGGAGGHRTKRVLPPVTRPVVEMAPVRLRVGDTTHTTTWRVLLSQPMPPLQQLYLNSAHAAPEASSAHSGEATVSLDSVLPERTFHHFGRILAWLSDPTVTLPLEVQPGLVHELGWLGLTPAVTPCPLYVVGGFQRSVEAEGKRVGICGSVLRSVPPL